jgi:hypothetical protein
MPRTIARPVLFTAFLYLCWLAMMAVHELGHMLHAWVSGGRVISVRLPLVGFSQTIVWPNPHERFVVWGGPVWGALIPLVAGASVGLVLRRIRRIPHLLRFFCGFCLVANGAYLAFGWIRRAGDTGDLLRLGTAPWEMMAVGGAFIVAGLFIWHLTSLAAMLDELWMHMDPPQTRQDRT